MKSRFVGLLLASLLLCGFVVSGCEDDPILDPKGADTGGGGSYGKIALDSIDASNAVERQALDDNPELF